MNTFITYAVVAAYAAVPAAVMAVGLNVGANGIINVGETVQVEANADADASVSGQYRGRDDIEAEYYGSQEAAVSLEGSVQPLLMKTEADLEAYSEQVAETHESIQDVQADVAGSVRVKYRQPAKLLGVINVGLGAAIEVDPQAQVSVHLPWYHFLFATDAASVEAHVQAAVNAAVNGHRIRTDLDSRANTAAHVLNGARMITVVTASVEGSVSGSVR